MAHQTRVCASLVSPNALMCCEENVQMTSDQLRPNPLLVGSSQDLQVVRATPGL